MKLLVMLEDPSPLEQLLNLLTLLFAKESVEATALTVIPGENHAEDRPGEELLSDAKEYLKPLLTDIKIRQGKYVDEVLKELEQGSYDLAVIQRKKLDTHGLFRGVHRFIRIVDHVTCSVLVFSAVPTPRKLPKRLLICDSGSERAAAIYDFINTYFWPGTEDLEITVLHVMSQIITRPGVPGKELRSEAEDLIEDQTLEGRLLERDIQRLRKAGFNAQPKIRHGLVVEEISSEVKEGDYDLVIIGAHPRGPGQAVLLENIARKILLALDRSVLIVSAESGIPNQERQKGDGKEA